MPKTKDIYIYVYLIYNACFLFYISLIRPANYLICIPVHKRTVADPTSSGIWYIWYMESLSGTESLSRSELQANLSEDNTSTHI